MRLAVVSPGELFGGVERQIVDVCRHLLAEDGVAPRILLFGDGELAGQLRDLGVEPTILRGHSRYDWSLVRQLQRELRAARIDVVHAHGYKATIVAGLARRSLPFRLVKTEHGKPEASWRRPVAWCKSRLNLGLEHALTRAQVDHVCYVTEDIGRFHARRHRGLARSVVYNGLEPLDRSRYARPDDLPAGGFNLGIVGRVSPVKGIPFAIEAMARCAKLEGLRLLIIGSGPILSDLERLVRQQGLADRIELLGFRQNIYDYIAHLDGLLMPSLHEGLPYTILEAMSLARPIIASQVGGLPEALEDGRSGLLVPVGDVDGLAAAIERVVTDPTTAATLGENARRRQIDQFTLQRMVATYRAIWAGTTQ